MNAMGYDAAAIGNHEFNYGIPTLDRAIAQARFPFLGANIRRADGTPAYRAWTMVERGGVKVALLGATTPGVLVWDRDNVARQADVRRLVPAIGRGGAGGARRAAPTSSSRSCTPGSTSRRATTPSASKLPSENVAGARRARGAGARRRDLRPFAPSARRHDDRRRAADAAEELGGERRRRAARARPAGAAGGRSPRSAARWCARSGVASRPPCWPRPRPRTRRAVAYAASEIGTTPVAWRADSVRVADTPLHRLHARGHAAHAPRRTSPRRPPSRSTRARRGPDHGGRAGATLSVREHAARGADHGRPAARVPRAAARATTSRTTPRGPPPARERARSDGSRLQLRRGRGRRLRARRVAPDRRSA